MKNAVLCFIVKNGKTLLIRKKRGFGQGKLIAPGGRIESGETPESAAVREFEEETGIHVKNPEKMAEIEFYFDGKKEWHVHIVKSEKFTGNAKETEEGVPFWHDVENLPYGEMWADDAYWVPLMLEGKYFRAKFFYDKEVKKILKHEITVDGSVV